MNDRQATICRYSSFLVLIAVGIMTCSIIYASEKKFWNEVLQQTTCSNIDSYRIEVKSIPITDFPTDTIIYYQSSHSDYDFGVNYTCWWNPFNHHMDLVNFNTVIDGSITIITSDLIVNFTPVLFHINSSETLYLVITSVLSAVFIVITCVFIYDLYRKREFLEIGDGNVRINIW